MSKIKSLDIIEKKILDNTRPQDREVLGIWGIDCFFNPRGNGRVFDYKILLTQTAGQGCAYSERCDYAREFLRQYVGKDFADCGITDTALKVSLLDSLCGNVFPAKNKKTLTMDSDSQTKMKWRSQIIYGEATRLLGGKKDRLIVNVGVVGDIMRKFSNEGFSVVGTDFDPEIIGRTAFDGIEVVDGRNTLEAVAKADLAVITGMTVTTSTIDGIIDCCRKNNVKTIVFAETAPNMAGYYVENGIDVYLSEHFPFYIFNGQSAIDVCYA
ncbi:MAG: DUF364 domain-containing protein [Defluviitaleaceae bacterium]|nr:DUF364 domain-containing protein [Defluviitaleaceae bacterium]